MKKYLIVGGNSGIGLQIAQDLLHKSEEVCVMSRIEKNADLLSGASFLACDTTQDQSLFPSMEGALDGIIYCPGSINLKPFRALKEADFLNDLQINYLGAIKVIQKYLPNLQQGNDPNIILFSTVAVQKGMPYHTSIAGAKGAIEGLVKALAAEFAPKIRVNAIAPSLVQTPLSIKLTDTDIKVSAAAERHPLKKIGQASDISEAAQFLLQAKWVSGQILGIDGGLSNL